MSHSPLLEADIDALDDPTFTSPGLAARDAVEHAVDRVVHEQVYGSTENTTADVEAQSDGPPVLSQSQLISIISSLYIGGFLSALDTTVVTTLLSTIASDIN